MAVNHDRKLEESPIFFPTAPVRHHAGRTKPLVLIVTAYRWTSSARIGMSFAEAGWTVEAVCPRGHIVETTRAISRFHDCRFFAIANSIRRAISSAKPDLVVPCDDLVAGCLRHLCDFDSPSPASDELRALLTRSLGDPACYGIFDSRIRVTDLAREEGVAVPETAVVRSIADLEAWVAHHELPGVLKVDGSSGGHGVRLVSTLYEARSTFAALSTPTGFLRAVKRAVVDGNESFLMPSLKRIQPSITLQSHIVGDEATCTCACWQGKVLACVTLRIIKTSGRAGASTVVQVFDDPNILQAVERLSRRLRISGLYGFDFIIQKESRQPFLIEINPRATQTMHLRTDTGSPAFALRFAVTGEGASPAPLYKNGDTIALFPQEWLRDPESDLLRTAHPDVPWNEPEFVRACLRPETGGLRRLLQPGGKLATLFSQDNSKAASPAPMANNNGSRETLSLRKP